MAQPDDRQHEFLKRRDHKDIGELPTRDFFVKNFAHGQGFDLAALSPTEAIDFEKSIAGKLESDEVAQFSLGALHRGLECVDVRPSDLIGLLYLDRIPLIHEIHFAGTCATTLGHRANWIDAAVDSHVANLPRVLCSAESHNRPVLELERWIFSQLFFGLWQVAND